MNPTDLNRLRLWCGYPHAHHFRPDQSPGDEMILVEKLLGDGWNVQISKTSDSVYSCLVFAHHRDGMRAEDESRRGALCLAALGVCP
jgi:hypothetical protein